MFIKCTSVVTAVKPTYMSPPEESVGTDISILPEGTENEAWAVVAESVVIPLYIY